jgi:phage protein D
VQELYPSGRLTTGPDVREHFFPDRKNAMTLPNETNLDDTRGQYLADVAMRKRAREFFTIEGSTIGLPRLRPGTYVEIVNMRPPFDGFFYVVRTVHSYGTDGYRTSFSARRPGMPMPPYQ